MNYLLGLQSLAFTAAAVVQNEAGNGVDKSGRPSFILQHKKERKKEKIA